MRCDTAEPVLRPTLRVAPASPNVPGWILTPDSVPTGVVVDVERHVAQRRVAALDGAGAV